MIDWAFGNNVWWLLTLPVLLGLYLLIQNRSENVFHIWFSPSQYKNHHPVAKYFLNAGAVVLILIALAGPYWGNEGREVSVMGREVYFLVDVSASMNCTDLKPSRLEKTKKELRKLIQNLRGDKMGLIVFTSHGYVQCPLTTDEKAVGMFLDLIETSQFANTGTDLRAGLSKCLERFSAEPRRKGKKVSRAVVVLTDGEHFGDKYTSVVLRLQDQGVDVIPVAIGTEAGAPVPESPGSSQYKSDPSGQVAVSKINRDIIEELSHQTGHEAFYISGNADNLQALSHKIKNLPASVVDSRFEQSAANKYQWFLGAALMLMMISMYLTPLRK